MVGLRKGSTQALVVCQQGCCWGLHTSITWSGWLTFPGSCIGIPSHKEGE